MSRLYRPLSTTELSLLQQQCQAAVSAWAEKWFPSADVIAASTVSQWSVPLNDDIEWYSAGKESEVILGISQEFPSRFCASLFGAPAGVERTPAGYDDSFRPLFLSMMLPVLGAFTGTLDKAQSEDQLSLLAVNDMPAAFRHPWTGAARLEIKFSDAALGSIVLGLSFPAVIRITGVHTPTGAGMLARRKECISEAKLRLDVSIPDELLSLRDIQSMRPGDVVLLSAAINAPFKVSTAAGRPLGACRLGRQAQNRAIRIEK